MDHRPEALNALAKFETIRALAEDRGYNEAPVSVLLLDGKAPGLVFEKLNNTFARRHHLRVWLRPVTLQGKPVWAIAATHDVGINFLGREHVTFIHRIDSGNRPRAGQGSERSAVHGTRRIDGVGGRPNVPRYAQNATGDNLETDGRIAVLVLM